MPIEKRPFVRTGHMSLAVIFGADLPSLIVLC